MPRDKPAVFSKKICMFPLGMFFASLVNFDNGTLSVGSVCAFWAAFWVNLLLTPLYIVGSVIGQIGYVVSYPVRWVLAKE